VVFRHFFYDRQSQPGTTAGATNQAIESFEDLVPLLDWNAGTGVGNGEFDAAIVLSDDDIDATAVRRIKQRVIDEVADKLLQACSIAVYLASSCAG